MENKPLITQKQKISIEDLAKTPIAEKKLVVQLSQKIEQLEQQLTELEQSNQELTPGVIGALWSSNFCRQIERTRILECISSSQFLSLSTKFKSSSVFFSLLRLPQLTSSRYGSGVRDTARVLKVSPATVIKELKKSRHQLNP